jgi:predicted Zn-dependent protease
MGKFFRYLGHKAGPSIRKGKWIYNSYFSDKKTALQSEYLVGRELSARINQEMQIISDDKIKRLLSDIGDLLFDCITNKQRRFEFNVVAAADLNAFALPGGFIYITRALVESCHLNRDELAFVMAHEMVHVVLKHPLKRILSNFSFKVIENMLRARGTAGQIAKQTLSSILRNGYSRENELEADLYAVKIMVSAGFDAKGAISLLQHLQPGKEQNPEIFNYFSSHPPLNERIEKIQGAGVKI